MVLFWVACHLFVPGFVQKAAAQYGERLGYEITYQDLRLSPLRLQMEIDGLHLAKKGGSKLIEFKRLLINLKWTKLVLGEIGFDEIILDEPKLHLERRLNKKQGAIPSTWNWQEFVHALQKNLPPKDPDQIQKPLKISVGEFLVGGATLDLVDEASMLKEALKPFSIKLLDIANYDQNGQVSGVRGQYDFKLG
jgi:uncharacterized protein involved in outer membrane biogenesis